MSCDRRRLAAKQAAGDYRPTVAEIMARRVEYGWAPAASALEHGQRIPGYAACVVPGEQR